MRADWIPERFSPTGGLAADGFAKLLGRPDLDPLTVLVRETAQNSWDARDGSGAPVDFIVKADTLGTHVLDALRTDVFHNAKELPDTALSGAINDDALMGLYISDRNTKGLGGPVQGDLESPDGNYDWVDFILNVGKANADGLTGGTYGFGKTIAYIASQARTIVVHSRALHCGKPVSRLIACSIGSQFSQGGLLYTGRHWWGRSADGMPSPLEGAEAELMAKRLGMPETAVGGLGTNILILAPDFGGRTPKQAMTFMAESILWHLWPKFTGTKKGMNFQITLSEEEIAIADPDQRPPLDQFVRAYRSLQGGKLPVGGRLSEIKRYSERLGSLATVSFPSPPLLPSLSVDDGHRKGDPDSPRPASPLAGRSCHHTVLLRAPQLVVEYREGPVAPAEGIEWAGVFLADDHLDHAFAQAEPPTHDSWQPRLVAESNDRLRVAKALRDVDAFVANQWGTAKPSKQETAISTASVANALSHLVPYAGEGKGRPDRPTAGGLGQGGKRTSASIELLEAGPTTVEKNQSASFLRCRVTPKHGFSVARVQVRVGVALDGSVRDTTLDPLLELIDATYGEFVQPLSGYEAMLEVRADGPVEVLVRVRRSPNSAILWDLLPDPAVGAL